MTFMYQADQPKPDERWTKLTPNSRWLFDEVYRLIDESQGLVIPAKMPSVDPESWKVIALNSAWIAANVAKHLETE